MKYLENIQDSSVFYEFNSPMHIQVIQKHHTPSNEVILEDLSLPGLAELKGRWHGSLDASGGGNGDTMVIHISVNAQGHKNLDYEFSEIFN